jgi:ATP-dependent protease Clp ATPase subunit
VAQLLSLGSITFMEQPEVSCSFCRLPASKVSKLIAGNGIYICDSCVMLCYTVLKREGVDLTKKYGRKLKIVDDENDA